MANDVKIRFRSFLPGGGFNSEGDAKQGKTRVVGEVDVTDYQQGGEALSAIDIGLNVIDSISLRVSDATGSSGNSFSRQATYVKSVAQFYLATSTNAGSGVEQYADAATETLEFDALGDSAGDVELLP